MIDVILLDGENRSTLAATRSLGSRGLNIAVVGSPGSISHASKYCKRIVIQSEDPSRYLVELKELFREVRPSLFLPMTDRSIGLISTDQGLYSKAPLPDQHALKIVQEKENLLNLCSELDISAPQTKFVSSENEIGSWDQFPAILKTARAGDTDRKSKPPVRYFQSKSELQDHIRLNSREAPWLLQEQIIGPGIGVFLLAQEGEIIATFCHQRILDKPPSGGVSVLSKSISRADAPVAEATKLLKALNWTGVAMVEFKWCNRRNKPFLMEINPRFWGSLQLSISAGVDFPWLLYLMNKMELGTPEGVKALEAAKNYKVGKRLRWDLGTLDHLLIRLKKEGFQALSGVLLKNELQFSLTADTEHETISHYDLDPFWAELRNYIGIKSR